MYSRIVGMSVKMEDVALPQSHVAFLTSAPKIFSVFHDMVPDDIFHCLTLLPSLFSVFKTLFSAFISI